MINKAKANNLPKRKHPRLKNYDYSSNGAYFVTICTQNRRCVLSRIVGRGIAPAGTSEITKIGEIAEKQLLLLNNRYPNLKVDHYVIMPNHIHVIFILNESAGASPRPTGENVISAGANPRPTIMDIVCAYKSLTTRECRKIGFNDKLFQTSFYEHIIRNQKDYEETVKYVNENSARWLYDELYVLE